MVYRLLFIFLLFTSCIDFRMKAPIDVLAIGQSNMHGRGTGGDMTPLSTVKVWNGDAWTVAQLGEDPFYLNRNNLAFHFCKQLSYNTGREVRLLLVAEGGTAINTWIQGGENYNKVIAEHQASKMGDVDIILFHQGESDADRYNTPHNTDELYREGLIELISNYRVLGLDAYFIAGELKQGGIDSDRSNILRDYDGYRYGCASSVELSTQDTWHFTGPSLVKFGVRYFDIYNGL